MGTSFWSEKRLWWLLAVLAVVSGGVGFFVTSEALGDVLAVIIFSYLVWAGSIFMSWDEVRGAGPMLKKLARSLIWLVASLVPLLLAHALR